MRRRSRHHLTIAGKRAAMARALVVAVLRNPGHAASEVRAGRGERSISVALFVEKHDAAFSSLMPAVGMAFGQSRNKRACRRQVEHGRGWPPAARGSCPARNRHRSSESRHARADQGRPRGDEFGEKGSSRFHPAIILVCGGAGSEDMARKSCQHWVDPVRGSWL